MNSIFHNTESKGTKADLLVREFGVKIGLPVLSLNAHGLARIGLSGDIEIHFEHDPERGLFHLLSPISALPEIRPHLQMECLLRASLLAVTSGGPAFTIDALENRFLACQSLPLANLDVEMLYLAVDRMAGSVEQIRKELTDCLSSVVVEESMSAQILEQPFRA